jgi:hypothetical protein
MFVKTLFCLSLLVTLLAIGSASPTPPGTSPQPYKQRDTSSSSSPGTCPNPPSNSSTTGGSKDKINPATNATTTTTTTSTTSTTASTTSTTASTTSTTASTTYTNGVTPPKSNGTKSTDGTKSPDGTKSYDGTNGNPNSNNVQPAIPSGCTRQATVQAGDTCDAFSARNNVSTYACPL